MRELSWSPQRGPAVGVEVLDRATLFRRVPTQLLIQPERLDFHLVIVCTAGRGDHEVDGVQVSVGRGVVLHIQPGQIHQWDANAHYEASLLLARQMPLVPPTRAIGPRVRQVDETTLARAGRLFELACHPPRRREDQPAAERAVADLLAICLDLTAPDSLPEGPYAAVYHAYQDDLAAHPDVRHTVTRRAARLGVGGRTLTRACMAMAGRTAKQEADTHLALEARRLLAVPELSVTEIASTLGFSEPTNFAKFLRRVTGHPPATWRRKASAAPREPVR